MSHSWYGVTKGHVVVNTIDLIPLLSYKKTICEISKTTEHTHCVQCKEWHLVWM